MSEESEEWMGLHLHESDLADRLASVASAQADLSFVVGCCQRLDEDRESIGDDPTYVRALTTGAFVAYVRAVFDPQRRWLRGRLEKRIQKFSGKPDEFHQWVKDMRDKNVAHNVNPHEDFRVGALLTRPEEPQQEVLSVGTVGYQWIGADSNMEMLRKVATALLEELEVVFDEVWKDVLAEVKAVPIEELRKRPVLRQTIPRPDRAGQARTGRRKA